VVSSNGTIIHLVGYGDEEIDLSRSAAVTVAMDTPYLLAAATSPTLIATYSSSELSLTALAAVLAGIATAPGRSPVAVNGLPRSACFKK
jgi:beta-N-acetylhexosaminidase